MKFVRFLDSIRDTLAADRHGNTLELFMYAVTIDGWIQIREPVLSWMEGTESREVRVFVGTDHGLTEPAALMGMAADGVEVFLLTQYNGVYHPKVAHLHGSRGHVVWCGSNNLTGAGLLHNIEFAVCLALGSQDHDLAAWEDEIRQASRPATDALIREYERERSAHLRKVVAAGGAFTWSRRRGSRGKAVRADATLIALGHAGDLVVEIMPRETGTDGKQVQLPMQAAADFFRLLPNPGETKRVRMICAETGEARTLTLTVFGNHTARLSLHELDYSHRPCVVVFHRDRAKVLFEIVPEALFPERFTALLAACTQATRAGSRRWGVLP